MNSDFLGLNFTVARVGTSNAWICDSTLHQVQIKDKCISNGSLLVYSVHLPTVSVNNVHEII